MFTDDGIRAIATAAEGVNQRTENIGARRLHTIMERLLPELELHAEKYGVGWKLASARSVDLPVLDLEKGREQFVGRMVERAVEAIEEDGAHTIVLGCTGLAGLDRQVTNGLGDRGYHVPVVDPASTALKVAETLVELELAHSKKTYPPPPDKKVIGYPR